ncbi:MAG: c-type cytochrome [bacterium]
MPEKLNVILIAMLSLVFLSMYEKGDDKEPTNSNLRVSQIAGKSLFDLKKCVNCHTLAEKDEGELTPVTNKRDDDWFAEHVEKESPIVLREESSKRKQRRVLGAEIKALADYLYESKPEEKKQIDEMSENVFYGAYLIYQNSCLNCHSIAGMGKDVGPDLSHVGKKHKKDWFIENFKNPQQFAPESVMPKFNHLPEEDLEKMAEYLLTLK